MRALTLYDSMNVPDRPVSIQVGGRTFATRLSTLHKYPDALLWRAYSFNERNFDLVFWDKNPCIFECLLEYYRTGSLSLPRDIAFSVITEELLFWGFDISPPARPPWPVVPAFPAPAKTCAVGIRCPLGIAWRGTSSGCHYVLMCLVWQALGRCSSVWEIAQRGYRSMTLYWKTRAPGIDFSLLRSHVHILQRLAELDCCRVTLLPEVTTATLGGDVRNHDLYTNGHLHFASSSHVATWTFPATYRKEGHELLIQSKGSAKQTFSFDHRGFRVTMHVQEHDMWWYMDPLQDGDVAATDGDVGTFDASQGFVLEVMFVINRSVFSGFSMPSCYYRTTPMRADIFMGQTFEDPPEDPLWYHAPGRHKLKYETSPFEFLESHPSSEALEMVVVFEEKTQPSLVCHPASNIVPYSASTSFSSSSYDRLLIEW